MTKWNTLRVTVAAWGLTLLTAASAHAVLLNQIDTFQNGTTNNWTNGVPAADPVVITTGGPTGTGDEYLKITADGSAAAGRLTSFNRTQWLGNYNTAGVHAISMDLLNLGSAPLSMRLAFKQTTVNGAPGFVTTTPFSLPADSLWHHATFSLSTSAMTRLNSTTLTLDSLLAAPAEFRILQSTSLSINGDNIISSVGVDNIRALPEPSTLGLIAFASFLLIRHRRPL